jgi:putative ABC transport system permease protein
MRSYFKLALKVLGRRKFFTFISIFGITVTLVVLVVVSAILDNVFEPRKPESRFDRVLRCDRLQQRGPHDVMTMNPGYGFIHDYILNLTGIEAASAYSENKSIAIYRQNGRTDSKLKKTDAAYWKILDFDFVEGRAFSADEVSRGALVAVITKGLAKRLFENGSAIDKNVEIDGQTFRIIGVVPDVSTTRWVAYSEVWVPHTTSKSSEYQHQFMGGYSAIVLAKSRADLKRIKNEFDTRVKAIPVQKPFTETNAGLDTPFEAFARDFTSIPGLNKMGKNYALIARTVIAIAALLFMLLPSLNLITLNLSRILERAPEIGVRKAFGASRGALVAQFIFENVVLTLIGGVIAFVAAVAVIALLNSSAAIPDTHFDVNFRVFGYGMLMAAIFGIVSGVYPAWRMSRFHPVNALRGGAQ